MKKFFNKITLYARLLMTLLGSEILMVILLFRGYKTSKMMALNQIENVTVYLKKMEKQTELIFAAIIIIMTLIIIYFRQVFKKEMRKVVNKANEVALGKPAELLQRKNKDELGRICDSMNGVIKNNIRQSELMEEIAKGNLTVEVVPASEEDILGISIKNMVYQNRHAMMNISDSANQVLTSSSEVAGASEALAQGSTEQASAIEQITVSINDIAEKTRKNADEASNAAKFMDEAMGAMKKGENQMSDMMSAMQDINASSESISKIIKVIDDIAFQTNILALNAAVEAARAGDAGKGFAVVAEEVRNLAARSAEAAKETAELIESSIVKVNAGSDIVNSLAGALTKLTELVSGCGGIVSGIAEASNYQATAISQVNNAIEQVSEVVSTNSATSEQCAAASVELSNQAKKMKEYLSVYRLGGRDEEPEPNTEENENEQVISLDEGFGKY